MRQKLRKVEQMLVSFKVESLAASDPDALGPRDEDGSNSPNSVRARALKRLQQTQRRGGSQGVVPARSAAGFAMVEDDVERLQEDLAQMAQRLERT